MKRLHWNCKSFGCHRAIQFQVIWKRPLPSREPLPMRASAPITSHTSKLVYHYNNFNYRLSNQLLHLKKSQINDQILKSLATAFLTLQVPSYRKVLLQLRCRYRYLIMFRLFIAMLLTYIHTDFTFSTLR